MVRDSGTRRNLSWRSDTRQIVSHYLHLVIHDTICRDPTEQPQQQRLPCKESIDPFDICSYLTIVDPSNLILSRCSFIRGIYRNILWYHYLRGRIVVW